MKSSLVVPHAKDHEPSEAMQDKVNDEDEDDDAHQDMLRSSLTSDDDNEQQEATAALRIPTTTAPDSTEAALCRELLPTKHALLLTEDGVIDTSSFSNDHLFAFASQENARAVVDPVVLRVIGHGDLRPRSQRLCMCFRPNWLVFMRKHCTMQEFLGSMGNISAFLPLLTALAMGRVHDEPQLEFGPALFFTGIYTLALAAFFNIPMPLQPMKYVAAVAIAEQTSRQEIVAAGLITGFAMLLLGVTNAIGPIATRIPMCIVRGIQLGLGIGMMMGGLKAACVPSMHFTHATDHTTNTTTTATAATATASTATSFATHQQHHQMIQLIQTSDTVWFGADSVVISLVLGILCVVCMKNHRIPIALVVFGIGICLALVHFYRLQVEYDWEPLHFGPEFISPVVPSLAAFENAFNKLFLPQFPVTLLNSVVGFERLATELFPMHHYPASLRKICFSIGFGNLLLCWFGMLPVCHGASGLASQYASGARSSMSLVFLGLLKVVFALLFGSSFVVLLQKGLFPASVLGIMLVTSGLSLASVGMKIDTSNDRELLLLLLTASATLGLNTGAGFYIGMGAHLLLRLLARVFPHL